MGGKLEKQLTIQMFCKLDFAVVNEPPQGSQQLSSQSDDHRLADAG